MAGDGLVKLLIVLMGQRPARGYEMPAGVSERPAKGSGGQAEGLEVSQRVWEASQGVVRV